MAPLAVDPAALDRAGADVVSAGESLGSAVSTLTTALSGCAGMAGDDPAGAALGRSYDATASRLIEAMVATRNGLCSVGDGVRMSAHNYSLAEAMSHVAGQNAPLPVPPWTGPSSASSPPSSAGNGDSAPPGWGWVAPYIGMIWPTADSGKLRAAAAAWRAAGTKFALAEIEETAGPMGAIRAQQIPEGAAIDAAFSDAYDSTAGIVQQCQTIAAQLSGYATKVDNVHAAIRDLLARICDPLTGIKEVWDVLTDEDEDEIKTIADDIRTVVDNFTAEVDALRGQFAAVLAEATTALNTMGDHAAKQWDQFLRGTVVGQVVNEVGQRFEGVGKEGVGLVKGLWEVSQARAVVDPIGYLNSMGEVSKGIAPLVGASGEHAPGVLESWKQLGKDVTHWDEWKTNPGQALGKSEFDLATTFLPGGPISKLDKMGTAARDALGGISKGLRKSPTVEPPTPPPVELPKAPSPKSEPAPRAPQPDSTPQTTPAAAPAGSPAPHSPTESKTPTPHEPAAGPALKAKDATPAQAGRDPGPAPQVQAPHPSPRESLASSGHVPESPPHSGEPGANSHQLQSPDSTVEIPDVDQRTTISGHGAYYPVDDHVTVPRGTTITVYAEHGSSITDDLGNLIEGGGDTSGIYSRTFQPGEQIPNYTIYPPDGLSIVGTPQTVVNPTLLSELIEEDMGQVHLAICPFDQTCPTGLVYDVKGIFDESTGIFSPYGGMNIDDG